jgi:hypothetical protein
MAGIRKREIVGCTLAIALFGVVASPAFAVTVDLGQTSVSTDTGNLVQDGSTGSSESPGGSDAVSDLADTVTDASGASTETSVDPSPVPDPSTGQPADQTGSTSSPLEQQ